MNANEWKYIKTKKLRYVEAGAERGAGRLKRKKGHPVKILKRPFSSIGPLTQRAVNGVEEQSILKPSRASMEKTKLEAP